MAGSREERIRFANEELLGNGNLDVVDRVFAADYVAHGGGRDHKGRGFARRFVTRLRTAIPDLRVVDVTVLSRAGDVITWQRTLSGTHTVEMKGVPPSGKRVKWREMFVTRFEGEEIAEDWMVSELAGELLSRLPRA